MLALGLLLCVPLLMWVGQTIVLLAAGQPVRWGISSSGLPRRLHRINRIITNLSFVAVLAAYPLMRGEEPLAYYARFFPIGRTAWQALHGFVAPVLYLAPLFAAWALADQVRFSVRRPERLARRLAAVPLSAACGAAAEELLFRAMLLAALLESLPTATAVAVGTVVFAAAHYVRRVKRYWTFAGHLALGLMLCVAFACTRTLWLPVGLHAGGIFVILGLRPFVRYRGPGWLVGASIFPYAGAAGIVGLGLLTVNMWLAYGAKG